MANKKIIIQIPCFNESKTLGSTIQSLPSDIPGVDSIELLVIDDGSSDLTIAVAKELGVHHIVSHVSNRGLAKAFITGIDTALKNGADIIVNTDADNQYNGHDIEKLVRPILNGNSDMVVGTRPIDCIEEFSWLKKTLQKMGSFVMRRMSNTNIQDAPSGFRAFNREVAMHLNVVSEYTYTLETLIQVGQNGFSVSSIPIRVNPATRVSRLVKSISSYVFRSIQTMARTFVMYRPFKVFMMMSGIAFLGGLILSGRFLVYYMIGNGGGKIQSLILAALLLGSSLALALIGLVADLISINRKLLERNQVKLFEIEDAIRRLKQD